MTESPKTVMVVAGGEWQLPIIAEVKRLGHRVLNTNLYENSPGFAVADLAEVVDVLDVDGNIEFARRHRPDAVLTDQSDIAVRTVALVAEALDLPGIGREVAERFTNKLAMRTWCRDLGVTQPDFASCGCVHEAQRRAAAVGFPLVMKPPASQSSRGVRRVEDLSEVEAAFGFAQQFSNDGSVLIENFIDGTELTAEGVSTARGHVTLAISTKDHLAHNPMVARRLVYSSDHADIPFEELRTQNDHLIDGMDLAFGLTHTEYKYSDGKFVLVETAARGGGTKISSHIVPYMSGVATNSMLIGMSLGQVIDPPHVSNTNRAAILEFLTFPVGRVAAIEGVDEARSLTGVIDVGLTFAVGDTLMPPADDRSRHLHIIATGSTEAEAAALVAEVERIIVVRYV
jgi:biotin carboxylase